MDGPLPQENTNGLLAESSMDKQQAHFPDEKLHYKFAIFHAKSDPLGTVTWNSLATTCKAFGNMYGAFSTKFHRTVPSWSFGYEVCIDFGIQNSNIFAWNQGIQPTEHLNYVVQMVVSIEYFVL